MIRIFLGNVGSGKTISVIKEMVDRDNLPYSLHTYSNIITKSRGKYKIVKNHLFTREMWLKKELIRTMKDGTPVYKTKFNKEVWEEVKAKHEAFNIVIDEAHTLMDSRNSMSRQNRVINEGISLIRKICTKPNTKSTLTLISQLDNRIDIVSRDMATEVRYHIGMWDRVCQKCKAYWSENSEMSDFQKHEVCPICSHYQIKTVNLSSLVHFFANMKQYQDWKYNEIDTIIVSRHYTNLQEYFPFYDTFQMSDLISEDD